eukprot:359998-Chlamydomonas_euryale.AAC.3
MPARRPHENDVHMIPCCVAGSATHDIRYVWDAPGRAECVTRKAFWDVSISAQDVPGCAGTSGRDASTASRVMAKQTQVGAAAHHARQRAYAAARCPPLPLFKDNGFAPSRCSNKVPCSCRPTQRPLPSDSAPAAIRSAPAAALRPGSRPLALLHVAAPHRQQRCGQPVVVRRIAVAAARAWSRACARPLARHLPCAPESCGGNVHGVRVRSGGAHGRGAGDGAAGGGKAPGRRRERARVVLGVFDVRRSDRRERA